jgi:hypothetical protein
MDNELMRVVIAFGHRLVTQAERDDGLRDDLRSLAEAVLIATERSSLLVTPEPSGQSAGGDAETLSMPELPRNVEDEPDVVTAAVPEVVPTVPPLPELTLGGPRSYEVGSLPEYPVSASKAATTDAELPAIEARCRLKAEAIRWAATRCRLKNEGANFKSEIAPRDRKFHDRAKELGCYIWMSKPEFIIPRDLTWLENVARCFELVADAVALVRGMLPDLEAKREFFEPALDVLAEAQSALRVAIDRIDGPIDPDQFRVYDWLRGVAAREQIFIYRHMRLDDLADPALRSGIGDRIQCLETKCQEALRRAKKRKAPLNRLRYHAKLIGEGKGGEHDWRKVAGAIQEMVGDGVPASSLEIREVLIPILGRMPDLDNLPADFRLVLREIDRYLAGRMTAPEITADEVPTPEVAEATRLLKDKGAVLIGGSRRPVAYEALKAALGLKELIWIPTREHESIDKFGPAVARPEVALVLLAIRWSSHSFGDVKRFCDRHGKPMVRLPGGYNPNQVAAQILAQCSRQLDRKEGSSQLEAARCHSSLPI